MASGTDEGGGTGVERDPEELFCLRWNDYQDNVMATLSDLRQEEDFFDVTLAVDGRQLRAHKLILSACSFFFRRLLRANPAPNPVVVLWDVAYEDMVNLIDFMYNGEVRVKHASIQSFLAVAEKFRVRGLCQNESSRPETPQKSPAAETTSRPSKRQRRDSSSDINEPEVTIKDEFERKNNKVKSSDNVEQNDDDDDDDQEDNKMHRRDVSESEEQQQQHHGSSNEMDMDRRNSFDDRSASGASPMMGLPGLSSGGLIDPNAAKEFWRRAAAIGLNPAAIAAAAAVNNTGGGSSGVGGGGGGGGGNNGGNSHNISVGSPSSATGSLEAASGLRRPRSVYTGQQITQLETYFRYNEYIDGERKRQLSQITNIPEHQIKVWFQNRRQKKKREVEAAEQQHIQLSHFPAPGGPIGNVMPGDDDDDNELSS